jgi:prepilin-type N-terminal cleavage/methylation domain-containing protein
MKQKQQGFTLVEIAIVLVIIGLLLGGILKGQEMITQAKIKNVIADMSGVSAAMYGYQDRYRALPGDDSKAGGRWTATAPGDGNGIITGVYTVDVTAAPNTAVLANEAGFFWHHLRLAGFISGSGREQPFNAVSGKMGVQTSDGSDPATSGTFATGVLSDGGTPGTRFTSLMLCSANLPDKIAISVDSQTDDGIGTSGTVRGQRQAGPNPAIGATATVYTEDGVSTYVVCRQM